MYAPSLASSAEHDALRRDLALRQCRAHRGRDDRAEEFDRAQDRALRLRADRHLHEIALMAERLVLGEDLGDRLVRRPDHQMTARTSALIELRPRQRRPAALAADAAHHFRVGREEPVDRGFSRVGEEAVAIDADGKRVRRDARAAARLAVEIGERLQTAPARRR